MKHLISSAVILSLLTPHVALAAGSSEACYQRMASELTVRHDEFRSRLFGSRRDPAGDFAVLTGGQTDAERKGIFETKRRLTSELIEPLVESYRVYKCRSLAVCKVLEESYAKSAPAGDPLNVDLLGCAPETLTRYPECYLAGTAGSIGAPDAELQADAVSLSERCDNLVTKTLAAERAALRLAVAYDTGYRSLLQVAGMMEWMLSSFPVQAVKAVSDMVNMLGKLHQIPCFITQCDNPERSAELTPAP